MSESIKKIKATTHKDGTITVSISEKPEAQFYNLWNSLGRLERKLFKKIQWYSRTVAEVFPSQVKLARDIGCGRVHVNKTLKKFKEYGWLTLVSRGPRRTKKIFMTPFCVAIDVYKIKAFTKYETTSDDTDITLTQDISFTSGEETSNSHHTKKKESLDRVEKVKPKVKEPQTIAVSDYLKTKYNFKFENQLKLSLLPEGVVELAIESTKIKMKNNWGVRDHESYAVETALRIAQNRGLRVDWRSYYHTLKNTAVGPSKRLSV